MSVTVFLIGLLVAFAQRPAGDEQQLRDIQQGLARAWVAGDRAFIERVLAPEWTSVQPDGTTLTRDLLFRTYFGGAVKMESLEIDDVRVDIFGSTAVVRGRTSATALINGARTTSRLRFIDVFVK